MTTVSTWATEAAEATGSGPTGSSRPSDEAGEWTGPALAVATTLEARPDDPVTTDRILRRLEVLRQRLSVLWCGSPGAFAGYDRLETTNTTALTTGTIRFTARLVGACRGSHIVEYTAERAARGQQSREAVPELLVRGRGRSLELHVRRDGPPAS
jgi:hypothetical protein